MSTSAIKSVTSTLYGRSSPLLLQRLSMVALDSLSSLTCSLRRKVYKQHCSENVNKYFCGFFFSHQLNVFFHNKSFFFLVFQKLVFTRWTCLKKNFNASISCVFLTYIHPDYRNIDILIGVTHIKGKRSDCFMSFNLGYESILNKLSSPLSPRDCWHFWKTINTISSVWFWMFCFLIPHSIYNNML